MSKAEQQNNFKETISKTEKYSKTDYSHYTMFKSRGIGPMPCWILCPVYSVSNYANPYEAGKFMMSQTDNCGMLLLWLGQGELYSPTFRFPNLSWQHEVLVAKFENGEVSSWCPLGEATCEKSLIRQDRMRLLYLSSREKKRRTSMSMSSIVLKFFE